MLLYWYLKWNMDIKLVVKMDVKLDYIDSWSEKWRLLTVEVKNGHKVILYWRSKWNMEKIWTIDSWRHKVGPPVAVEVTIHMDMYTQWY